jgi:hypothetical protein
LKGFEALGSEPQLIADRQSNSLFADIECKNAAALVGLLGFVQSK